MSIVSLVLLFLIFPTSLTEMLSEVSSHTIGTVYIGEHYDNSLLSTTRITCFDDFVLPDGENVTYTWMYNGDHDLPVNVFADGGILE